MLKELQLLKEKFTKEKQNLVKNKNAHADILQMFFVFEDKLNAMIMLYERLDHIRNKKRPAPKG